MAARSRKDFRSVYKTIMNQRITIVFGTRPEAIKLSPVILALKKAGVETMIIHTGQHAELADDILSYFKITPDIHLTLMKKSQPNVVLFQRLVEKLNDIISPENCDTVLVQGDTTSALAGAMVAHFKGVKVAHLEAGLRSHDPSQPFPEESNRKLISHIANLHFAPTAEAKANLLAENIDSAAIHITGNSVVDALKMILSSEESSSESTRAQYASKNEILLLLTTHRRENLGRAQQEIFKAVIELVDRNPSLRVVFPVHPNPEIQKNLSILEKHNRVSITEPLSYFEFIPLMAASDLILTDSGGIQEEAPALGVPVFVLRNTTERPELIQSGAGILVGTKKEFIIEKVDLFLSSVHKNSPIEIYGDGQTSNRVVALLTA